MAATCSPVALATNSLNGGLGGDTLSGSAGNDTLIGASNDGLQDQPVGIHLRSLRGGLLRAVVLMAAARGGQ